MKETTARPMELTDTAELMASSDYKDRFKAEYGQVAIRCKKLRTCPHRIKIYAKACGYAK